MLRQNHSGGSSTSRSFAKTALLRARRKTFQFSDEQFARHIFFTEPLFLIPSVQTEVVEAAREVGFARGPRHSFRGNHFSSFLPAEIGCPETPADRIARNHCTFFEGTTFPPSFRPRLAQQEATTLG